MRDEEQVENVVRFPRDWVGPPEELVPIGPRARARAREADAKRAEEPEHAERGSQPADDPEPVPAAGDFWGEGAAALHHPIQAPPADFAAPLGASSSNQAAPLDVHPRNRRARRLLRPHRAGRSAPRARVQASARVRRPVLVATACAATALIAAAVLLLTSGNGQRPASSAPKGSFVGLAAFRSTVLAGINGIAVQVRHETHVARARAVERTERRRAAEAEAQIRRRRHEYLVELRRRRAASAAAASSQPDEPADTATSSPSEITTTPEATTPAAPAPEATTPAASAPEPTTPEATTPTTSDSSASSTAEASTSGSAPAGPTGIGGSTGGCNPQCR